MGQPVTNQRRSLRNLKTAAVAHIRSKPCGESQRFLDLYVLQRDRLRWGRTKYKAEQMIQAIDVALAKLGFSPEAEDAKGAKRSGAAKTIDLRSRPKKNSA